MAKIAPLGAILLSAWGLFGTTQDKCDETRLRALVGMEPCMYFRGEAVLANGRAVVSLPSYFEAVVVASGRSVQLTCRDGCSLLSASPVVNGQFIVQTDKSGNPTQPFWWEVKGVCTREPCSSATLR